LLLLFILQLKIFSYFFAVCIREGDATHEPQRRGPGCHSDALRSRAQRPRKEERHKGGRLPPVSGNEESWGPRNSSIYPVL